MEFASRNELAREVERVKLKTDHPHLIVDEGNALITATKNMRIELKRAWPGIRFSIKSSRYTGGDSIRVRWTDGPTSKEVDSIVGKYKAGSFDGMTDCYEYDSTGWTRVFGDAQFVFTEREYSDALVAEAIDCVCNFYYGRERPFTVEDYRRGRIWSVHKNGADIGRELNIWLSGISRAERSEQ